MKRGSDPPEPCMGEKCRTPVACEEFGYCRERVKAVRTVDHEQVVGWLRFAAERRKHREREPGR